MISFRVLKIEDLPFLLDVRNDSSTRCQLENDSTFTLEESTKWFLKNVNDQNPWALILKDNQPIGYFRVSFISESSIMLGCDIHPDFRGKGLAKLAYNLFINQIKEQKIVKFIFLWVFEDNIVAINLYKKLGFEYTNQSKQIRNRNYIEMKLCLN